MIISSRLTLCCSLLVGTISCNAEETIVLSWPGDQTMTTRDWVVLVESETELLGSAHRSEAGAFLFELEEPSVELYAIAYDQGLSAVDLSVGPLDIVDDPEVRSRALPKPSEVYRRAVSRDSSLEPWASSPLSSRGMAVRLRDDRPSTCATFAIVQQLTLDTPSRYVWFVDRFDEHAVFIGSSDWNRILIDALPREWLGPIASATLRREDGSRVLGGVRGAWLGRWSSGAWVTTSTLAPPFPIEPFALALDPAGDLFALTFDGELFMDRDGDRTPVYDYDPIEGTNAGGLVVTPQGSLLAAFGASRILVERLVDGTVLEHDLSAIGQTGITALANIPELGVFLGTANGDLFIWEGGSEVRLLGRLAAAPRVLLPFREGMLVGGDQGLIVEYSTSSGLCPPSSVFSGNMRSAVIEGDRIDVGFVTGNDAGFATLQFSEP